MVVLNSEHESVQEICQRAKEKNLLLARRKQKTEIRTFVSKFTERNESFTSIVVFYVGDGRVQYDVYSVELKHWLNGNSCERDKKFDGRRGFLFMNN